MFRNLTLLAVLLIGSSLDVQAHDLRGSLEPVYEFDEVEDMEDRLRCSYTQEVCCNGICKTSTYKSQAEIKADPCKSCPMQGNQRSCSTSWSGGCKSPLVVTRSDNECRGVKADRVRRQGIRAVCNANGEYSVPYTCSIQGQVCCTENTEASVNMGEYGRCVKNSLELSD